MRILIASLSLAALAASIPPAAAEPHDNVAGTLWELAEARAVDVVLPPPRPTVAEPARTRQAAPAVPRRSLAARDLWISYGTGF
jgi:hypothetical protein